MNTDTLGMIKTEGLVGAIKVADAMIKTANASLVGYEKAGSRLVIVTVRGDVSTVKATTDADMASAAAAGEVISTHVISRPHTDVERTPPHLE